MTQELRDPNLPAGEIVDTLGDGVVVRNDGVELQPANKNPWYVLATLAGEQEKGKHDEDLAIENRRYWNGWVSERFSQNEWNELAGHCGLNPRHLNPLPDDRILKVYRERLGDPKAELPNPSESVNFEKVYFETPVDFSKYVFFGDVNFSESIFADRADFEKTHFSNMSNFSDVIFCGVTNFVKTRFSNKVSFVKASFSPALFSRARFAMVADFSGAHFSGQVNFHGAHFENHTIFNESRFFNLANFSSCKFEAKTRFKGAYFQTEVPEFHATQLYPDTVFPTSDKMMDHWPPITEEVMPAGDQKRAYNCLRLFMSKHQQIDEEMFFHRQEMACKAEIETGLVRYLFKAYGAVSDYGSSVVKPLVGLGVNLFIGWVGFLFYLNWAKDTLEVNPIWVAFGVSFSNIFAFFGFGRLFLHDLLKSMPDCMTLLAASQTVFGFIFLFLLGLGLRNRFRLR